MTLGPDSLGANRGFFTFFGARKVMRVAMDKARKELHEALATSTAQVEAKRQELTEAANEVSREAKATQRIVRSSVPGMRAVIQAKPLPKEASGVRATDSGQWAALEDTARTHR